MSKRTNNGFRVWKWEQLQSAQGQMGSWDGEQIFWDSPPPLCRVEDRVGFSEGLRAPQRAEGVGAFPRELSGRKNDRK